MYNFFSSHFDSLTDSLSMILFSPFQFQALPLISKKCLTIISFTPLRPISLLPSASPRFSISNARIHSYRPHGPTFAAAYPSASPMPRNCAVSMSTRHPGSGASLADSVGSAKVGTRLRFGAKFDGNGGGVCLMHTKDFFLLPFTYQSWFFILFYFAPR